MTITLVIEKKVEVKITEMKTVMATLLMVVIVNDDVWTCCKTENCINYIGSDIDQPPDGKLGRPLKITKVKYAISFSD